MRTKKRDFSRVVSLSLTLILVVVFSDESSERRQESITYSAKCFRGCFPHLRTSTKTKVFRTLDSSCYQLCLKKIKATRRQQFLAFAHSRKKRIRKERSPATKCPTSSPSQNVNWYPSEVNVSFGKYENTNHWFSNLSWTLMNDTHGNWTAVLVRFAVSHNSAIAPDVTCFLYPKNQTDLTLNISAYGFRYPDYLFLLQMLGFPFTQDALSVMETYELNLSTTTTHPPGSSTKENTATVVDFRYKRSTTKKSNDSVLYLYISTSVGVLVGLGLVAGLLVYFLRSKRGKSNNPLPQDTTHL